MRRLLIVALLAAAPGWAGCVAANLDARPAAQAPTGAAPAVPSQPLRLPYHMHTTMSPSAATSAGTMPDIDSWRIETPEMKA